MREGLLRRKPGEALSHLQNKYIRYLCPVFAAIILVSSVANALGWISM